jgi:DegV family protein with EDD domain
MQNIAFVTDSTAYIPPDLVAKYEIQVAPQTLVWGNEQFLDGVTISPSEFYARLKTADIMPTTSEVNAGAFKVMLEPCVTKGVPVVMMLLSSKLSGTVSSAEHAKAMFPEARIEIVDTAATSMAMGFQLLEAARAARQGMSFEGVVAIARKAKEHTGVLFVVDTLEFLHRGGRIGGASKLMGTALGIKPLLELREGRVEPIEKVRTKSKAVARMLDILADRLGGRRPFRLAAIHAAAEDEGRALLETARTRFDPIESFLAEASPVVGTHTGPGTVGIAYSFGV